MTLLRPHRTTVTCAASALTLLLMSGCSGTPTAPAEPPPAAATTIARELATDTAGPTAPASGDRSDPGTTSAVDPWAAPPVLAWERGAAEDGDTLRAYPAGQDVLLVHASFYTEATDRRGLELVTSASGTRIWHLGHTDLPAQPERLLNHEASAVPVGDVLHVALYPAPAQMSAEVLLQIRRDGTVLHQEVTRPGQFAGLTEVGLVRVDPDRAQLTVHPLTDWDQVSTTLDLGTPGVVDDLKVLDPFHLEISYKDGDGVGFGTAVVNLATGTFARPFVNSDGDLREYAVADDVVLEAASDAHGSGTVNRGCTVTAWRGGQVAWSRDFGTGHRCAVHGSVPYTMVEQRPGTNTDLLALDPATGQDAWPAPYPGEFSDFVWSQLGPSPDADAVLLNPVRAEEVLQEVTVLDKATGALRHVDTAVTNQLAGINALHTPGGFLQRQPAQYHATDAPGPVWTLEGDDPFILSLVFDDLLLVDDAGGVRFYRPADS